MKSKRSGPQICLFLAFVALVIGASLKMTSLVTASTTFLIIAFILVLIAFCWGLVTMLDEAFGSRLDAIEMRRLLEARKHKK